MKPSFFGKLLTPAAATATIALTAAFGARAATEVSVSNLAQLQAEIASYAKLATDAVIIVEADIVVTSPLVVNSNENGKNITIRGKAGAAAPTLRRGSDGVIFFVSLLGGATLTLENIVVNGNYPAYPVTGFGMPLLAVNAGSNVVMRGGAVLRNNWAAEGGAVRVDGQFTLAGGEISACAATGANSGGAVHVQGGTFTMTGGVISGNTQGDAVYVQSGSFTMTGGVITNNYGGAYVGPAAGAVTFGGAAKIAGNAKGASASNVSLANGKYVTLGTGASAPAAGMDIGANTASASGVIVQSGAAANSVQYFFADADGKRVALDGVMLKITDDTRPSISGANATQTNALTYNGSPQSPTFSVEVNGITVPPSGYTVEAVPQTDANTMYTAMIRGARTGAYGGAKVVTWAIGKADPAVAKWPAATEIPYGSPLSASALGSGSADVAGTFGWTSGVARPTAVNGGYDVTFTPADHSNFNTLTNKVPVSVTPAPLSIAGTPISADKPYDGTTSAAVTGVSVSGQKFNDVLAEGADYAVTGEFTDAAVECCKTVTVILTLKDTETARNYSAPAPMVIDYQAYSIYNAPITMRALPGELRPVAEQKPVKGPIITDQYAIRDIEWIDGPSGNDAFAYGMRYTAAFKLTPEYGYELDYVGMGAGGFFTVDGAIDDDIVTYIYYDHAMVTIGFQPTRSPAVISIPPDQPASITLAKGSSEALSVQASATQGAALKYQWYACPANVINGCSVASGVSTNSSYVVVGREADRYYYYCEVSATGGAAPRNSRVAVVTVKDIPDSTVFTYSLSPKAYAGSPQGVAVTPKAGVGAVTAIRYNNGADAPVNAGTYAVTVDVAEGTGYVAGAGIALGNYTIEKRPVSVDAAGSSVASKEYDGTASAVVNFVAFTGLAPGEALEAGVDYTVLGAMFESANAGSNAVIAGIALTESARARNYALTGGSFRVPANIAPRVPRAEDFAAIPTGRRENGQPQPIGPIYADPNLLGMGSVTAVYYDGMPASATHPVSAGAYAVTIDVAAGVNFLAAAGLALGTYKIRPNTIENISEAKVEILGAYVYSGSPQVPAAGNIVVTFDGMRLEHRVDYTFTLSDNVNAGTASVAVTGTGYFTGTAAAPGRFTIAKKVPDPSDLLYSPKSVTYNAGAQPVVATAVSTVTGLGAVTALYYNGSSAPPVNGGTYEVTADIAEGANYTARLSLKLNDTYTIGKKRPIRTDLVFSVPTDHYYTGLPQGIGPVTLKGSGYGSTTVLYNGSASLPVEAGTYTLTLLISGGENYLAAEGGLDTYTIAAEKGAAQSSNREIPAAGSQDAETVLVAALAAPIASEFSVGPNPVVGRSPRGIVNFFRRGKWAADGNLTVFDASGNAVNKIIIRDKLSADGGSNGSNGSSGSSGSNGSNRRVVGSWNLRDANGRPVANGTYLARGVIVDGSGKKERVSVIISVRF